MLLRPRRKVQRGDAAQQQEDNAADGVELDMGGLGKRDSFDNKLRQSHFQVLFNDKAKEYKLEEDQAFSNRSKLAKTWINGSKYQIYPQHIPGKNLNKFN